MDVGVLIPTTAQSGDVVEVARQVEALGYHSLWIPEHPIIPIAFNSAMPISGRLPEHYGRWVDPFVTLSMAAAVTRRIRLGTGICLLAEREPIVTAKAIATLDVFSGGRVVIGTGGGWLREETEVMGTPYRLRWKRLRETVEAMRTLWTQGEASYQGELVRFPAVRSEPKPMQKPYPPILLGAHGVGTIERIARTYDGWYPGVIFDSKLLKESIARLRQLAAANGRDPGALQVVKLVDPGPSGPSLDELTFLREAGVNSIVLSSPSEGQAIADGAALQWVKRFAPVVGRAARV
jgi:probable F420-dependent oxidoreductase